MPSELFKPHISNLLSGNMVSLDLDFRYLALFSILAVATPHGQNVGINKSRLAPFGHHPNFLPYTYTKRGSYDGYNHQNSIFGYQNYHYSFFMQLNFSS